MTVQGIIDKLKEHPGLAALVAGRVYPIGLPAEEPLPAVTYEIVGGRRPTSKDGAGRLRTATFRFTAWAESQDMARTAGAALADAAAWLRTTGTVLNVIPGSPRDDVVPELRVWLVVSEYAIWWRE